MLELKEGILISISENHIAYAGHTENDNPVCNAITDYLNYQSEMKDGFRYAAYFSNTAEKISIYRKGIAGKLVDLNATTMLIDWLDAYNLNTKALKPMRLKLFHQRDNNNQIEDNRLWIGIYEDGEGVSEMDLEKLYGLLSSDHIQQAKANAVFAAASGVNHNDTCPVTNVLEEMTKHLWIEVGIGDNEAEFFQDESDLCTSIPFTLELEDWLSRYNTGEDVKEGVIYINRNDALPDQPLFIGIDYAISNYNLVDFDKLHGMERRLTREHINDSKRGDCEHCAVAMVLSEMFPHHEVNVNGKEAFIHTRGEEHAALLIGERLGHWIDAYDNENDVGTYTLIIQDNPDDEYYKYSLEIKDLTAREKDLQNRVSKLSGLSADIEIECYYSDQDEEKVLKLERGYRDLYAETIYLFGN